ncbi:MAG: hypothetical protein Q4E16_07505 [Neisseria sp.]|nr:hypothetical protein [Neisseria sp.]
MSVIYQWDVVCFATGNEDHDAIRQQLDDWLERNFPLNTRGIPLHAMCMAAHACGMEWHIADYLFGKTTILLVQTEKNGYLASAARVFKTDILRIVAEQSS